MFPLYYYIHGLRVLVLHCSMSFTASKLSRFLSYLTESLLSCIPETTYSRQTICIFISLQWEDIIFEGHKFSIS